MKLLRITDRIWISEPYADTDRPVLALVQGAGRTLMVDGGNSPAHAEAFLSELLLRSLPLPDYIAVTHAHCDHVFGLPVIQGMMIANDASRDRIEELNRRDWNDEALAGRVKQGMEDRITLHMLETDFPGDRTGFCLPAPDIVYSGALAVNLGDLSIALEKIGGDHAPDSSLIHVVEEKTVFLGDCLYLRTGSRAIVEELYEKLLGMQAELYVDSHEPRPYTRADLEKKYRQLCSAAPDGAPV